MPAPTRRAPTEADVAAILATPDVAERNHRITLCYHELASAYAARARGANWCAFATWASRQAGETIRHEDLNRAADRLLDGSPEVAAAAAAVKAALRGMGADASAHEIRRQLARTLGIESALARSAEAVARGNAKVFAEIGLEFARFLLAVAADDAPDEARIPVLVQGLKGGEPPDGQGWLRDAFADYYRALFETDDKRRAELLFLANLRVGFHEQTRLQPDIREALDAALPPPDQVSTALLRALFPYHGWLPRASRFIRRLTGRPTPLDRAVHTLHEAAGREVRRLTTRSLMTLTIPPDFLIRLGADLPASHPPTLRVIDSPNLRALLARIDPTPDSVLRSGARDWADLDQRMHFITDFFRCFHEEPGLFYRPTDHSRI